MAQEPPELADRSIAELLKQLSEDTSTLVRQELALAKAELAQKGERVKGDVTHARVEIAREGAGATAELKEQGKQAGAGAGMMGGAALFALLALGALTAFLILLLDEVMPDWLAALIVTVLWLVVAGVMFSVGRKRLKAATERIGTVTQRSKESVQRVAQETAQRLREDADPVPHQTVETVKEDVQWAKTQM